MELQNNLLFGYLPDDDYNPGRMEDDGFCLENLFWTHKDLPDDGSMSLIEVFDGQGPLLHPQIGTKFNTVLDACGIDSGFIYNLMKRITAILNAYAWSKLIGDKFVGSPWRNITLEEMYNSFGIILKMSIDNYQLGGINAYFSPPSQFLQYLQQIN